MTDFEGKLTALLKGDARFLDQDGEILRASVVDAAYKGDPALVELLLGLDEARGKFFSDVKGALAFKTADFVAYIEDKNFLNDSYTRFKNKIGLTIDGKFLGERGEVALTWPFKDCVLEGGMTKEDQKRKEIFFNEILAQDEIDKLFAPKVLTNWKRYTAKGEEKVGDIKRDDKRVIRENFLIKGNNLLALHSLKGQFTGQVKLVYIDPPYNTGNDSFGYNDSFNHSAWLTFMRNRLEAVRRLLREDGSVWINIDDSEAHYLKIMCDDIFGRDNFVANIVWQKKYAPQNDAKWFSDTHDHILVFAKNKELWRPNLLSRTEASNAIFKNPDNDPRGPWMSDNPSVKTYSANTDFPITTPSGRVVNPPESRSWRFSKEQFQSLLKDNRIWFGKDGAGLPRLKTFLSEVQEGMVPKTLWLRDEVGDNQESKREINLLGFGNIFSTPKPERLLKRIIEIGTKGSEDIVVDFFAGSGTTLAVAHKMGRQYIGIEQLHYIHDLPEARLKKVVAGEQGGISEVVGWKGGGDFVYAELMRYNETFIEEVEAAKDTKDLLKVWKHMKEEAFFKFSVEMQAFEDNLDAFKALPLDKQKKTLCEVLDKNQLYVNLSEIDDTSFKVAKADQQATKDFYDGR